MTARTNDGRTEVADADQAAREHVFWRGLEELGETSEFQGFLNSEFPALASVALNRRDVLRVMAASFALAGLSGCKPDEAALPYVNAPEFTTPGIAKWYATAVIMSGYAQPVLGKTHVGRPTKLEGNPDHPASEGATDSFTQAALLGLYDPDRSRAPIYLGRPTTFSAFDAALVAEATRLDARQGEGFRLLTGTVTSPTLERQINELIQRWPRARWHVLEPVNDDKLAAGIEMTFGRPLACHLHLDEAEVVVSLDDDVLGPGQSQTRHARAWSKRRLAFQHGEGQCALLVAEPTPSITGVAAAHRLSSNPARIGALLSAIASALGVYGGRKDIDLSEPEREWVAAAAHALDAHRQRGIVTVGSAYDAELHALALLVNDRLSNLGRTIRFTAPIAVKPPDGAGSFQALSADMAAGKVQTLAVLEANPVYGAPGDAGFESLMKQVELRLHAGLHYDETAALSHWHVPLQHALESWSDARSVDGLQTIVQPLVRPFYDVRSAHGFVSALTGAIGASDRDIVRETWTRAWGDGFDARWRAALQRGFVADSAPPEISLQVREQQIAIPAVPANGLHVVAGADPTIWDGRFANNPWLQELPKPITKVTWGNVIAVSPATAHQLKLANGDEVKLTVDGRTVTGPIWILPGQAADTIAITAGYGRTSKGRIHQGLGYNANLLVTRDNPNHLTGASLEPTGKRLTIASTQLHFAMDGYDFVRTVDAAAHGEADPHGAAPKTPGPSFYTPHTEDGPSWGMSIDLDSCIGCNACVSACMAENNIPVVGAEQVALGREMHWLRVDRYYEGDPADPKQHFQPVPCMHCEQAPCEMGCPVNATTHSPDGLNQQVYNRCIGTRTCSSYCPYKVRRFNWFEFTAEDPPEMKAVRNPDVTVRARGVMEKCTYCVQRISAARIAAKLDKREIRDGDIVTACQQACPTRAISFGNVHDPESAVSRRKLSSRDYSLLEEANTRPRTTYLAKITTPLGKDQGQ